MVVELLSLFRSNDSAGCGNNHGTLFNPAVVVAAAVAVVVADSNDNANTSGTGTSDSVNNNGGNCDENGAGASVRAESDLYFYGWLCSSFDIGMVPMMVPMVVQTVPMLIQVDYRTFAD